VRRTDEFVETWFDVITYSTNELDNSVYLRREEFASVSCECELQAATDEAGLQPTTWNGVDYTEGALVNKQYGTEASNQQSQYCDVCCRDHHDTSRGPGSYRPWTSSANGNHKHYTRSNQGLLTEASVGDNYYEACRLIRKDGFFRVAQDFNLQNQTAFPENYLNDGSEVDDYSTEVSGAATDFFVDGTAFPADFTSLGFEGSDTDTRSDLPTAANSDSQQLRSRGIYADEVSSELADNLEYCFGIGGSVDDDLCTAKAAQSALEIFPFFDVQLTKLSRWTTTQLDDPVSVTNEEIENNNTHSRAVAALAGSRIGGSVAHSEIETGNVGLVSILPIANEPAANYSQADLYLTAGGDDTEPPPSGNPTITGTLNFASGTSDPAAATIQGSQGVSCTKPTNASFICIIGDLAVPPFTVTIGNFWKNAQNPLIACAPGLTLIEHHPGTGFEDNWTMYELPSTSTSGIVITVKKGTTC